MTWSLVQTASYASPNTQTAAPAATFTNPVGSGNVVCGVLSHFAVLSATPFTDDKSDASFTTWGILDDTTDGVLTAGFVLLNITSGPKTFTGHCNTSDFCMLNIAEWSNTGGAITATDGTTGTVGSSGTARSSGTIGTTVDGDLIVGFLMDGARATAPSLGTNFITAGTSAGSTAVFAQLLEYLTQATHGSIAATGTVGSGNTACVAVLAIKAPTGAAANPFTRNEASGSVLFFSDDSAVWSGGPIAPNLNLLAPPAATPRVVPPPTFDLDDPAVWSGQPRPAFLLPLLAQQVGPYDFRYWTSEDETPAWQRSIDRNNALLVPHTPQVQPTRHMDYDDGAVWYRDQSNFNTAAQASFLKKPQVQSTRHADYNDASAWSGAPTAPSIGLLGTLAPPSPFIVSYTRQFHYDDVNPWQWKQPYNLAINGTMVPPTITQFWHSPDDPPVWSGQPTPPNQGLLASLTPAATPQVQGTRQFNSDDPPSWQHAITRNNALLVPQFPQVQGTRHFDYDDAPVWQWRPYRRDALYFNFVPPVQLMRQFFQDDAAEWKHDVPHLNLPITALSLPKPQVQQMRQFNYDDASVWQRYIYRNYVINFLPPPQPPAQVLSGRTVLGMARSETMIGPMRSKTIIGLPRRRTRIGNN